VAVAMTNRMIWTVLAIFTLSPAVVRGEDALDRTFLFTYAGSITGLKPGDTARVWLPVARSNQDQVVEIIDRAVPQNARIATDDRGENAFLFFEAGIKSDGTIPFSVVYRVTRHEVIEETVVGQSDESRYLKPDALVPVGGKPAHVLLTGKTMPSDPLQRGRVLYELVENHMQYRKDQPGWGRGDATWACDSGFGNCTDFHSLFISLARSLEIPAKFEIGFAIPAKRGTGEVPGYHCWAKFKPAGHGWVPVDISEAKKHPEKREYYFGRLDANRVTFTTGRDLELVPKQAGPPVNFLAHPYVEVNGKPYPQEKIARNFVYQDVDPPAPAGK
jgi:transglutaminase-like putative cysteine protease